MGWLGARRELCVFHSLGMLWAGLALGLSFVSAVIKFQVPELPREAAFALGKYSFTVTNRIELVLALLLLVALVVRRPRGINRLTGITSGIVVGILALQTAWLMPVLVERIDVIIAGGTPPSSSLHIVYVAIELVKIAALFAMALFGGYRATK